MKIFDEYLYKYGFHDSIIDNIFLQENKVCFCFNSGIYLLDFFGKEFVKTEKCQMTIEVNHLNVEKIWEFIEISKIYKKNITEVEFDIFINKVKENKLNVEINYFSPFANEILLIGYIKSEKYEIRISEISNIYFSFSAK